MSTVLNFTFDEQDSEAIRVWIGSHPQKIDIPRPEKLLTAEGLAEKVDITDSHGIVAIAVTLTETASDDPKVGDRFAEIMRAFVDDANRLLRFVPDYGNLHSNYSAFKHQADNRWNTPKLTVPGRILYSHPDFVILCCDITAYLTVWFEQDGQQQGMHLFDKRRTAKLSDMVLNEPASAKLQRLGLGGRDIESVDEHALHIADIPAMIARQVEANNTLLEGHTLKGYVRPEHRFAYVDEDLILAEVRGFDGGVFLCYRRDGLPENREFNGAEAKRLAERARKAMAAGAKPGNGFRKWVEKKDYGFDISPQGASR